MNDEHAEHERRPSELEAEIVAEINDVRGELARLRVMRSPCGQPWEVAERFLCEALGRARSGVKGDERLAQRKLAAARNVLNGGQVR